jgi:AmpD protein
MIVNHKLTFARQCITDNQDDRLNKDISMIVIHNISLPPNNFNNDYIEHFFLNKLDIDAHPYFKTIANLKVSAHLLIKRDGSILQFVSFDKRAWHAGKSSFNGKNNCNDFSIGIELEGSDNIPYEIHQYKSLNKVIKLLKSKYVINDIVGHSDISPDRKTDPGKCFEWQKIGINK